MTTAIRIVGLVKEFPPVARAPRTRAVDGVSLDVEPGELFFLLGPSGCGAAMAGSAATAGEAAHQAVSGHTGART